MHPASEPVARGFHAAKLRASGELYMMTFINWESLLKIKHAENFILLFI
jgi:hypothetical protein